MANQSNLVPLGQDKQLDILFLFKYFYPFFIIIADFRGYESLKLSQY